MKTKPSIDLESLEGRTFILGRDGHIYIESGTVSKHHAEIRILDGKIHLRDLDSTNGTFLLKNKMLVKFDKGFVSPLQQIVIGGKKYIVQDLLAIAKEFVAGDESKTEIETGEGPNKHPARRQAKS